MGKGLIVGYRERADHGCGERADRGVNCRNADRHGEHRRDKVSRIG